MKKFLLISALILAAVLPAEAQKGLNVARVFDGRYAKLPGAVVTYVTGDAVEKYGLSLYRSLSLSADSATCSEIEHLVLKDGLTATSKETVYRGGRLRYGNFILPRRNTNNRYIFYVNKDAAMGGNAKARIVVVYMAGEALPDQVKKLIKKNE